MRLLRASAPLMPQGTCLRCFIRSAALPTACLNCGESFCKRGEHRRRFCPEYGQRTTARATKLVKFTQPSGDAYFATDGALWRTLHLLLLKPGELTRQSQSGRRKHYVLPLRLQLTINPWPWRRCLWWAAAPGRKPCTQRSL